MVYKYIVFKKVEGDASKFGKKVAEFTTHIFTNIRDVVRWGFHFMDTLLGQNGKMFAF